MQQMKNGSAVFDHQLKRMQCFDEKRISPF